LNTPIVPFPSVRVYGGVLCGDGRSFAPWIEPELAEDYWAERADAYEYLLQVENNNDFSLIDLFPVLEDDGLARPMKGYGVSGLSRNLPRLAVDGSASNYPGLIKDDGQAILTIDPVFSNVDIGTNINSPGYGTLSAVAGLSRFWENSDQAAPSEGDRLYISKSRLLKDGLASYQFGTVGKTFPYVAGTSDQYAGLPIQNHADVNVLNIPIISKADTTETVNPAGFTAINFMDDQTFIFGVTSDVAQSGGSTIIPQRKTTQYWYNAVAALKSISDSCVVTLSYATGELIAEILVNHYGLWANARSLGTDYFFLPSLDIAQLTENVSFQSRPWPQLRELNLGAGFASRVATRGTTRKIQDGMQTVAVRGKKITIEGKRIMPAGRDTVFGAAAALGGSLVGTAAQGASNAIVGAHLTRVGGTEARKTASHEAALERQNLAHARGLSWLASQQSARSVKSSPAQTG